MMLLWNRHGKQPSGREVLAEFGRRGWRRSGCSILDRVMAELDGEFAGPAKRPVGRWGRWRRHCSALDRFHRQRVCAQGTSEELGELPGLLSSGRGGRRLRFGRSLWGFRRAERWRYLERGGSGRRRRFYRGPLGAKELREFAYGLGLAGRSLLWWRRGAEHACEFTLRWRWSRGWSWLDIGRARRRRLEWGRLNWSLKRRRRSGRRGWPQPGFEPWPEAREIFLLDRHRIGRLGRLLHLDDRAEQRRRICSHRVADAQQQLRFLACLAHAPEMEQNRPSVSDLSRLERLGFSVLDKPNQFVTVVETHSERPAQSLSIIVSNQAENLERNR